MLYTAVDLLTEHLSVHQDFPQWMRKTQVPRQNAVSYERISHVLQGLLSKPRGSTLSLGRSSNREQINTQFSQRHKDRKQQSRTFKGDARTRKLLLMGFAFGCLLFQVNNHNNTSMGAESRSAIRGTAVLYVYLAPLKGMFFFFLKFK